MNISWRKAASVPHLPSDSSIVDLSIDQVILVVAVASVSLTKLPISVSSFRYSLSPAATAPSSSQGGSLPRQLDAETAIFSTVNSAHIPRIYPQMVIVSTPNHPVKSKLQMLAI